MSGWVKMNNQDEGLFSGKEVKLFLRCGYFRGIQVLIKFLDDFQDFFFFSYLYSVLFSEFVNGLSVVVSFFQVEKIFSGFFPFFLSTYI